MLQDEGGVKPRRGDSMENQFCEGMGGVAEEVQAGGSMCLGGGRGMSEDSNTQTQQYKMLSGPRVTRHLPENEKY